MQRKWRPKCDSRTTKHLNNLWTAPTNALIQGGPVDEKDIVEAIELWGALLAVASVDTGQKESRGTVVVGPSVKLEFTTI